MMTSTAKKLEESDPSFQTPVGTCAGVFDAVAALREAPLEKLRDANWLEHVLLPYLGLNDEMPHEFPQALYPWCGKGVRSWQYPAQFSRYLVRLSTLGIETYAEIGSRHGGTFIITLEYLKRFANLRRAAAIDLVESPILRNYGALQPFDYLIGASQSPEAISYLVGKSWDLVLIDGDHSLQGCLTDYGIVRDVAKRIALHDIVNDACPGVVQVWNYLSAVIPEHRRFAETAQYDEVLARTGHKYLGIGVVDFS